MHYNFAPVRAPMSWSANTRLVIGPNASLNPRQAWWVMGLMSGVGLGIAGVWTLLGFWPVLPFAGLELAALGAALWLTQRRNRYREVLHFDDDRLRIEIGLLGDARRAQLDLPRGWTRVRVEPRYGHEASRLLLSCSGQHLSIGACLTDAERGQLAQRIAELLGPGARRAPLEQGAAGPAEIRLGD